MRENHSFDGFCLDFVFVDFYLFWCTSMILGWMVRSGKALGFISSDLDPNPSTGSPEKGSNRGAIIIIRIPERSLQTLSLDSVFLFEKKQSSKSKRTT